jgi:F-type H+-transporting ATPase subunit a
MNEIHISLPAEVITHIGFLPITNTLIITWFVMFVLILFALTVNLSLKAKTPGKLQIIAEMLIGGLFSFFSAINGKHTKTFFPLLATIFIVVLAANWTELIPGMHAININILEGSHHESIPILRAPSTDLNFTLALALISVFSIQWFGIKNLGGDYIKKFINFSSPAGFFVGILEIISEISRIISFAFRLFGNIFAGEVLLTVIAFLIPLFAPIPFLALELFVGLVQALVFSMLTAVFLNVAVSKH